MLMSNWLAGLFAQRSIVASPYGSWDYNGGASEIRMGKALAMAIETKYS